ncbi:MAG TPA: SulP family inorganic anion transporter [Gemmatimonadales bacterium]|jgi:SulP family sulfate permease|nr:SulP family inorganic anion transporter [Gemmatimonadales bacterium]
MLVPKLVTTLRTYTREQFAADLTAGLIVGVVALPLAIAFAIASGVTPDRGLYTAVIAGFLISAIGGSRVQIGGPTGAFVVIVYGIVQQYGIDGLTVATIMAGFILIGCGLARIGAAIKFIPFPVVTGFTSGIALILTVQQLRDVLGLRLTVAPPEVIERLKLYGSHLDTANPHAIGLSLATLLLLTLWPRVSHKIPAPFVALILTTIAASLLRLPVETIGSRFGAIHAGFPSPTLPTITLGEVRQLVGPALAIAALGAVESLLSAVVADGMIGGRHRSNMELIAQGVANVVTPVFGGIPATGAIARTATNVKSGGRTPVAGMAHAVTLLVITLFFGRLAGVIPLATLATIVLWVAYRMAEWRVFRNELSAPRSDAIVMVTTFLLTVLVDLTAGIGVGMVLASLLFMKRMAEVTNVTLVSREFQDPRVSGDDSGAIYRRTIPPGVEVYEINGPFFFGAAEKFKDTLSEVSKKPKVLIVRLRHVPAIDSTAMHALRDLVRRTRNDGTQVFFADVHAQPLLAMERAGLLEEIGDQHFFSDIDEALAAARMHLGLAPPLPGAERVPA